jgi:hypothetical protein
LRNGRQRGGNGEKLVYSEDLSEIAQLNISFKTIHILGQVLRSFPGDIKKELKIRIADQCYLLGLRMLSMALGAISSNSDYLRMYFTQLLLERHIDGSAAMLSEVATNAILDLAVLWAFAVVKTLSSAVGMEELSETYKDVLRMHEEILAVQVIDSSIKLDHFGAFPDAQLERLHKRTRKTNYIAFCAIRNLLLTHYQLYRSNHVLRAKFTTLYSIDMRVTKLVEGGLSKQ